MSLSTLEGELAALTTALFWAVSSVIYARLGQQAPPLLLNLLKGLIAIGLLLGTIILVHSPQPHVPLYTYWLLLLSGAIGIGFGDTVFFAALNHIGARQTLLIQVAAPPIAAIGEMICLKERLSWMAWIGIGITISGIAWVISERNPAIAHAKSMSIVGLSLALMAALAEATGAILSRLALSQTTIAPLWSALFRLVGGTATVLGLLVLRQSKFVPLARSTASQLFPVVAVVAFFSTYLGIWLQQIALKSTTPGIAQTLGATSPLFVLPIVMWQGERVSWQAMSGCVVALIGIGLLFLYGAA